MWSKFLKEWNGVSFFVNDDIVNAADIQLFTDATMTSFGGYYMWLFLRSTALLLHAHKNTVFYRYNIIEAGKTVADV